MTTGVASGLGRYIHERWGGLGFRRETSPRELKKIRDRGVDVIIHCAASSARSQQTDQDALYPYLRDSVLLTQSLVSIPHKKFVFLSSVDVYPKNGERHHEDEVIPADGVNGIYAMSKLMSEAIVRHDGGDCLILRPTSLLGPMMRKNSLTRIIEGDGEVSLSGDSQLNCVSYCDLFDFIRTAVSKNWKGIYNVASSENITLREISRLLKRKTKFGSYRYRVGHIDNRKITSAFPAFCAGSREMIEAFLRERDSSHEAGSR